MRAAWLAAGASLALTAAAVATETRTRSGMIVSANGAPNLVFAGGFSLLGALIVTRRPRQPLGWLFLLVGLDSGVTLFAYEYAQYSLVTRPGSLPGGISAGWLSGWVWTLGFPVLVTFCLLLYPDGKLPSPRWRPALLLGGLAVASPMLAQMFLPGPLSNQAVRDNPLGVPALAELLRLIGSAGPLLELAGLAVSVAALITRWLRAPRGSLTRRQITIVALGAALVLVMITIPGSDGRLSDFLIGLPVFTLIPAAIAFAILRDRLYDLDVAINRSVVYGTLAVLLALGYAGVLTLAGLATGERPTFGVVAAVTAVAVVALPLRAWLQRLTDRLMFGDRGDPYAAVSRVSATLQGAVAPGGSLDSVVSAIAGSLRLAYVAVETPRQLRASVGEPCGEPVTITMTHQGTPVGTLIAAGPPGRPIGPRDRALLTELARHAGAAVYAAGLADDLQASRQRLVEAREEERRRLRRDLHDGLGPGLASVVLGLDLAAGQLRADPGSAHAVLTEVKAEMVTAVDEIRRLVYELRPPALDDLGLVGAIRQQAERIGRRHPMLSIAVEAPESLPSLPAATEVAAYRIATEAMTNSARHSRGTRCTVRIGLDGQVSLEVADDGAGLPPLTAAGVGLAAMRERAQELGGTFEIRAAAEGGTRLLATLPLDAPSPQPLEAASSPPLEAS